MAKYYNTTRGPLAVALSSGGSVTIPPKTWTEILPGDEGSPNLVPMVRKGYLKRSVLSPLPTAASDLVVVEPEPEVVLPVADFSTKSEVKLIDKDKKAADKK